MADTGFAALISMIAHELRSPLTAVQGFSGTLVKRWDSFGDDQRRQLVQTIYTDAQRMGRIISEVVDLARLETGRLELERSEVNVAAVAERAAEHLAGLPGADRLVIRIDDDVVAWADVDRLEHILTNLMENAIKFSDEGRVEVAARSRDGAVEITVSDRGVGIAPDRLQDVFSAPAPSGQRAAPSGTGLGLYLTRRLVEAHDGSIAVDSELDVGSVFTVRLPAPGEVR
jgi:signal transduction histidine kinase